MCTVRHALVLKIRSKRDHMIVFGLEQTSLFVMLVLIIPSHYKDNHVVSQHERSMKAAAKVKRFLKSSIAEGNPS